MRIVKKKVGKNHYYIDTDDGDRRIPGVTTVVKGGMPNRALAAWNAKATTNYAIDNWDALAALPISERMSRLNGGRYEARDAAADKGKLIHRLAEDLQEGRTVEMPEGLEGYVLACKAFLDDFDFVAAWTEAVCYSETRRHVGTLDALGTLILPDMPEYGHIESDPETGRTAALIDWTTGKGVYAEKAYQLAAYRHSEWMMPEPDVIEPMPEVDVCLGVLLTRHGTYEVIPTRADEAAYRDFLYLKEVYRIADDDELRTMLGEPLMVPRTRRYKLTEVES
jgi:hypothetical protein